jgi:hypothetical protein
MNTCESLVADNIAYLQQGVALLRRMDPVAFARGNQATASSGFGPHLRHCLDHYECFLAGVPSGCVDYDARERDVRTETDPARALEKILAVIRALEKMGPVDPTVPLDIKMDCGGAAANAWSNSTVGRELQFLVSHTVHHYALISFVLRANGIEPGADFGVAPSTLRHRELQEKCAR